MFIIRFSFQLRAPKILAILISAHGNKSSLPYEPIGILNNKN